MDEAQQEVSYLDEAIAAIADEKARRPFVCAFEGGPYGPGDMVRGSLSSEKALKARELAVDLRYVDSSFAFSEETVFAGPTVAHRGELGEGQELSFSFELPADALPNWAGRKLGAFFWAIGVDVDRRMRPDVHSIHPVPVVSAAERWRGPDPAPELAEADGKLDVELLPDRRSLRRGEELRVGVRIAEPAAERSLRVAMVCTHHFEAWVDSGSNDGAKTAKRLHNDAIEESVELDSSAPEQEVQLSLPAHVPFSYNADPDHDGAVGFEWKLVAREDKRARRDPRRELRVEVLP